MDPVALEILRNALAATAAEMDVTVWRTSRSTVVRELLDYSTAVFDAEGQNVAQAARIPQHLNSMGAGLLTILREHLPVGGLGGGRRRRHQRSLLRRAAHPRHPGLPRGVRGRRARGHRGHAVPPPGHGRHGRRLLRRHRDRGVPGGAAHPTAEARAARRAQRGRAGDHAAERAPPGHAVGGPAGAARLAGGGRGGAAPAGRAHRRGGVRRRLRADAGRQRAGHARHDRPHPRRPLRVGGLPRRRRHHPRADPHPRRRHRGGRGGDGGPVRLRPAGAGSRQRDAGVLAAPRCATR